MNIKKLLIALLMIILVNLFTMHCSEAVEVQLQANTNNEEAIKKIDDFFKSSPFPDSAYNVEIDKNVTIQDGHLELKFKLTPKQDFFISFSDVIKQALEYEWINEPWVGIKVISSQNKQGYKIAVVNDVTPGSPAWDAHIRKGDQLRLYNGKFVDGAQTLEKMLVNSQVGENITVEIIRDDFPRSEKYLTITVKVAEKKVLKRKGNGEELYGVKISGAIYYMPKEIVDSIANLINKRQNLKDDYVEFPLIIRYEFKDENGNIIQTSDIEYTNTGYDYAKSNNPQYLKVYGKIEYTGINFDTIYKIDSSSRSEFSGKEHKQSLGIQVPPEKIKEIVASVANLQKKKEEEQERYKRLEEEQKQIEAREAEQKIREDELKRQEKAKEQRRKALLPKCNNKILTQEEFLIGKNPHADKGKCVAFMAATFQMTSTNAGLFDIGNNELAYIEFKKPFRGSGVQGIARIKGMHTYVARSGMPNQVPHLEMLEIEEIIGQ